MNVKWWQRLRSNLYRAHIPARWGDVFTLRGWWDSDA